MLGPAGFGTSNFVPSGKLCPTASTSRTPPTATAPRRPSTITDQLDPTLDWSTFQLTEIGFGDTILTIPAGSQHYQTTVPMTYNGKTFDVLVEAGIHTDTGQVYATFQSIDPNTQLPPDVLTGFLPPEDGTGRGMGYISYTIQPKAGLATGTQIRNVALITFDQNRAIATDQVERRRPEPGHRPDQASPRHHRRRPADQQRRRAAGHRDHSQLHRELVRPGRRRRLRHRLLRHLRLRQRRPFTLWLTNTTANLGHLHRASTATPTASTAWPPTTSATSSRLRPPPRPRQKLTPWSSPLRCRCDPR